MCDVEAIGDPLIFKLIRKELPKVKKRGQFPDESAKNKRHTNSQCRCPDVLVIAGIKEIPLEGRLL